MINTYAKDNQVRVSSEFTVSGNDTDPTTVKCFYRNPTGTLITLVYGIDGALVRDATGKYHVDIFANITGSWWYRFEGTGTVVSASEDEFFILQSQVL